MTPDNAIYYKLGYSVAAIIYVGYALTIILRRRALLERMNAQRTDTSA